MIIRRGFLSLLLVLGGVLGGCASMPLGPAPEVRQALAPSGPLRVGLYTGTPTSLLSESDRRGVGYDLGKQLARRLGVAFQPVVFTKNADVLDAVAGGRVDIAFTNATAERMKQMDFTEPYMVIELGYLAAPKTPVRTMAEVDRPGIRVGVTAKSNSDSVLSRQLKYATVVRVDTVGIGVQMLAAGTLDVYSTNKAALFEMADKLPGGHMFEGSWGDEHHAIAMPLGRERGHAYMRAFVADVIASGQVRTAMVRAGLRGAVVANAIPATGKQQSAR